jgi:DNA polymerase III gamma/tau subunit
MPLHLEYRPDKLDSLLGNEHLKQSLKSVLESKDRPRVFLLHGKTGCGKTTLGRIIADTIGCAPTEIKELDIGDARGIDNAREIKRDAAFLPMDGGLKVYILDEVQNSLAGFQEALLKTLEDTPEHVVFILCTTDPHKLKPTIRNRCSSYEVMPLPGTLIKKLLKNVLQSEKVDDFPIEALDYIVQYSQGVPREALTILNQVIDLPTNEEIIAFLKSYRITEEQIESLVKLMIANAPWIELIKALKEIKDQDVEKIRRGVLGYCSAVLMSKPSKRCAMIMDCFSSNMFDSGMPGLVLATFQTTL